MSEDNWQKVETIIDRALELPDEKQIPFIEEQCRGNAQLKGEVTLWLESILDSEGWLERPSDYKETFYNEISDDVETLSSDQSLIGETVGSYIIKKEIGKGGMGTVYMAERRDGEFEHRVAIKIMRRSLSTQENIIRFKREQQILAGLNHPGIAKLFDGGVTDDGSPYIIMEYVSGMPIDQYCKEHECQIEEKITLFKKALDAVRHAHENLIIHRDLKPGNILVDEAGNVKILDFGISKLLQEETDSALTQTGSRLFTPRYAAPEQIRREQPTTAIDLYAMGIVFYIMLSGSGPFNLDKLNEYEMEQAILNEQPQKPSTKVNSKIHRKKLQGDLDAIALKAIRKEPEQRYRTANDFLSDLNNYQQGLPVSAQEGTFKYRAQKFVKRHKQGVAIAAGILLLIVFFTGFYSWQINQERDQAQLEAEKAKAVTNFLVSLFEANKPNNLPGKSITAEMLLQTGEAKIKQLNKQPVIQSEMLAVIGNLYSLLSNYYKADTLLRESLSIQKEIYGNYSPELASIYYMLAEVNTTSFELAEAKKLLQKTIAIQKNIYGTGSIQVAKSLTLLAKDYNYTGNMDTALTIIKNAMTIYEQAGDTLNQGYINALYNLAEIYLHKGQLQKAESIQRKALYVSYDLYTAPHSIITTNMQFLAVILRISGRLNETEALLFRVLEMQRKLYGTRHHEYSKTLLDLAELYIKQKKYNKADSLYKIHIQLMVSNFGENHYLTATKISNWGILKRRLKKYEEAKKLYKRALNIYYTLDTNVDRNIANAYQGLGISCMRLNQYDKAEAYLKKALNIRIQIKEYQYYYTLGLMKESLAELMFLTKRFDEGLEYMKSSLSDYIKANGKDHSKVKETLIFFTNILKKNGMAINADSLMALSLTNR